MARYSVFHRFVDLLLITVGFGAGLIVYDTFLQGGLSARETWIGSVSSVFGFWFAIQLKDWSGGNNESKWVVTVEQFCFGTGINLLLHALLTYGFLIRRTPFLVVTGSLFSSILLDVARRWFFERRQLESRVLLVGFDEVARKITHALRLPVVGVVGAARPEETEANPVLGDIDTLDAVIGVFHPTHLIVSMRNWQERIAPAQLLRYRLGGMTVEESQIVYERLFSRVCCERLEPMDLLLSSALRGDSRTMAIQAVYTNLVALFLLLIFLPVLALTAVAVRLFSGPGPIFESVECAGFQYIPFRLLRFRTTRNDGSAAPTRGGLAIRRLRLANLPQLINIVRGDMALVGPSAVRKEFAGYLTELMPFYSHRFSVKPGIIGWARMHAPRQTLADDCRQVEYDLYYIKEGSLWLDIEILLRALPGGLGSFWRKGAA